MLPDSIDMELKQVTLRVSRQSVCLEDGMGWMKEVRKVHIPCAEKRPCEDTGRRPPGHHLGAKDRGLTRNNP